MREIRTSGSEGGGTWITGSSYPYPDLSAGGLIVYLPSAVFPGEGLKLLVDKDGDSAVGADHDPLEMFQGGLQFGGLEFGPGIGVRSGWGREIVGFLEGAGGGKALAGSDISLLQGPDFGPENLDLGAGLGGPAHEQWR